MNADHIETVRRSKEALRLRLAGHTFGEIADRLNFANKSSAYDAYKTALNWATIDLPLQEIIQEEVHRLDSYTARLEKLNDARAVEVLVKVSERKARLLGLDAPEKKLIAGTMAFADLRVKEIDEDFVAGVIRGLDQISRPALVANTRESVDPPQADNQAGSIPSSQSA